MWCCAERWRVGRRSRATPTPTLTSAVVVVAAAVAAADADVADAGRCAAHVLVLAPGEKSLGACKWSLPRSKQQVSEGGVRGKSVKGKGGGAFPRRGQHREALGRGLRPKTRDKKWETWGQIGFS